MKIKGKPFMHDYTCEKLLLNSIKVLSNGIAGIDNCYMLLKDYL